MNVFATGSIISALNVLIRTTLENTIQTFAAFDVESDNYRMTDYNLISSWDPIPEEYDFIVVGSGSAGSVVANRLSEKYRVLLLERGGEEHPLQYIPVLAAVLVNYSDIDYSFLSQPQKEACLSLNGKQSQWNRGRGMGGSSNLNMMIYLRGHRKDFDQWANISGDERWNYDNIFPFYTKSEDYCVSCETIPNDPTFNPQYHHKNGFLTIGKPPVFPLTEEFLQASEWAGIPRIDLNGPYKEGASPIVLTQRKGRRCSTYTAFIEPIRKRRNLTIKKYARAFKILFRGDNEAYGVEYEKNGRTYIATSTKEVILSAGSIESAKLLMLSGIGPKDHLESMGIRVRRDLKVGSNLQDHVGTVLGPFIMNEPKSFLLERDFTFESLTNFLNKGQGVLAQNLIQATSFHTSENAKARGEEGWPDTQYLLSSYGQTPLMPSLISHLFNIDHKTMSAYLGPVTGKDSYFMLVYLSRPKSHGELKLVSADYRDDPVMDPQYLGDSKQIDIQVLVEGIKRMVNMSENSPSLSKLGTKLSPIPFPPCRMHLFRSDAYYECYARHLTLTIWHFVGTAAMGKPDSPNAVVDSELRVIGTKHLRVIDASIMPKIISSNTNGPTILIGERGAQFVLDAWAR